MGAVILAPDRDHVRVAITDQDQEVLVHALTGMVAIDAEQA